MDYHQALMRRLGMIQDLGDTATQLQAARQPALLDPGSIARNMPQAQTPAGGLDSFVRAISGQESGGSYGAVNKSSGALGKYQVMPSNLGGRGSGWDYEALGRDISPQQYLKSPQLQEAIAQYKLKQYYQKWGPAGAAVAWYAGPGTVSGYMKNPNAYTNPQGAYPSIANYVQSVLGRMG